MPDMMCSNLSRVYLIVHSYNSNSDNRMVTFIIVKSVWRLCFKHSENTSHLVDTLSVVLARMALEFAVNHRDGQFSFLIALKFGSKILGRVRKFWARVV